MLLIGYLTMLFCFAETSVLIPHSSFWEPYPEEILSGKPPQRRNASPKTSKKRSTLGKPKLKYMTAGKGLGFHNPSRLRLRLEDDNIAFLVDEENQEYFTPGNVEANASSLYQDNTLDGLQLGLGYLYKRNLTWRLTFSFWNTGGDFVMTDVTPELPELTLRNLQTTQSSLFVGQAVKRKYFLVYAGPSVSLSRYEMDIGNYRYNTPIDTSIDILGRSWPSTNKPTPDLSRRMLGANLEIGGMLTPIKLDSKNQIGVGWDSVFGLNWRDAYSRHTVSLVLTMR